MRVAGVGLGGLLLLVIYLLVPKTTVVLYPPTQPIAETLELLAGRIAVLNEEPTVGGGQSATPLVGDADLTRARAAAADRARSDALNDLRGETQADETLLTDSLDAAILEEAVDHRNGDQATTF